MAGGKEWRCFINWEFPYKGNTLSNPQYIKDKEKLFKENGNGWWCNDGKGWNMNAETIMQYNRRLKREKRNKK